ncbi:MAG: 2-C-methyl-D-erythritol 4-phosphate cytidylyltransferase [Bifidobacteriaceae bacterium]|jgi:2-C-methyl-D-erythritol 4-phosphate cytidylyltransferase|nr:2-C-methyl-D-erythritol 4-phosphate cytidylyltransferase [Bifidobacteriaceae bacterium]
MRNIFIVLAGGVGERMGSAIPKQLLKIAGKPIIEHTLENIIQNDLLDEILVVLHKSSIESVKEILKNVKTDIPIRIVDGGETRTDSTLNALSSIEDNDAFVLLHDAVRPFIDNNIINRCLQALQKYNAVDTAIVSADTIIGVDNDDCINSMPIRHYMRRGQTPQCFRLSVLRKAYQKAEQDSDFEATDNCGVVFKYLPDEKIKVIDGTNENMKITENIDLQFADKIFQMKTASFDISEKDLKKHFQNMSVMVIGGSYGIGKSCVELFSDLGAKVLSYSRSETKTDITDQKSIENAFTDAAKKLGKIDLVVLTAGQLTISELAKMNNNDIRHLIEMDLIAPALIAKIAYPYLEKSKGEIIFFTSSSYTRGRANYSIYSAAKAGVVNLTQALSEEWAKKDIRVNCINPQRTATPMRSNAFGAEPEDSLLQPEAVARSTAETVASCVTGQIVDVRLI